MKKLISLLSVAMLATSVFAISATGKKMAVTKMAPEKVLAGQSSQVLDVESVKPSMLKFNTADAKKPIAKSPKATLEGEAPSAFYYLPKGAFTLGIGNAGSRVGTNIFEHYPTIIGSCLNGHETWVWPNYSKNANSVTYKTWLDSELPQYAGEGWTLDANKNFVDSTVATNFGYGISEYYYSTLRLPLQTATNDQGSDYFYLLGPETERMDTVFKSGDYLVQTMGGVFSNVSPDGMFPLSNAMFETPIAGNGVGIIYDIAEDKDVSFIYGTKPIAVPAGKDTIWEDDEVTIKEIIQLYDTIRSSALLTSYDQPMSPLYIKDVTIALGNAIAVPDAAGEDSIVWTDIKIDSLKMVIITQKGVVATSLATKLDTVDMLSFPGQLVTFKIQQKDPYGSIIEGITINEPFQVAIVGLNRPDNQFGVWSAYDPYLRGAKTSVMDVNGNIRRYAPYNPFVMLNGIYYTLEHALRTPYMYEDFPAQYINDTINIAVEYDATHDQYSAVHADGDFKGYIPTLRAIELLYDTVSYQYNYNIYAPDWAQVDMQGYDEPVSKTDATRTYWSVFNAYFLDIWGDASDTSVDAPAVGDEIKLSRYGRELVFKVVEVEEPTAINNVVRTVNDGKLYNVLGIEVDEDYKGVVIRNGQKFLK